MKLFEMDTVKMLKCWAEMGAWLHKNLQENDFLKEREMDLKYNTSEMCWTLFKYGTLLFDNVNAR